MQVFPWCPNLSRASTKNVYFHNWDMTKARNLCPESVTCLYSKPLTYVKRSVSYCSAFLLDKHLEILLQKGSVFCICRRACNLLAVRVFSVGSLASESSGVISGCEVELSVDRHWRVWLLVLKAGPSVSVTDDTGFSWGNSTRHDRQ